MKRKINWVVVLVLLLFALASTTYGWKSSPKVIVNGDENVAETLKDNVNVFCKDIGPRDYNNYDNLEKSKQYIISKFKTMGYNIGIQDYQIGDKTFSNIIATKDCLNKNKDSKTVIIGAHYDSALGSADGGASGISALITLADLYKNTNSYHNVRFVAFVNGEKVFAKTDQMGSKIYADYIKQQNENIEGVIVLDSIGYYSDKPLSQRYPFIGPSMPNKANFLTVVGNSNSKDLARNVTNYFNDSSGLPVKNINQDFLIGYGIKDSYSFSENGFKTVLFTDTSIYRFEHINREDDTVQAIDFKYMSEIVKNLKEYLISY
ncbi:M28 family peptidase [Clostridium sp. YIM B02505]|uniref:M28 family peptidase n=1 Tax=Clostridium yunnanense TaxID=2800325 RepID=A0ABS1EPW2_9CLOT|nr:M28 family peptidase [Clostridium yunnanense]MBK1811382.1 M28 family peptidase [Clostridium yunnanense]